MTIAIYRHICLAQGSHAGHYRGVGVVYFIVGVGTIAGILIGWTRYRRQTLERAAEALGLSLDRPSGRGYSMSGRMGELDLSVTSADGRGVWVRTTLRGFPDDIRVSQAVDQEGVRVGDPALDAAVSLRGVRATLLAWMDAGNRAALLGLARTSTELSIENAQLASFLVIGPVMLETEVRDIARHAQTLCRPGAHTEERLVTNATEDPETGVRLSNLEELIHRGTNTPLTKGALRVASEDADPALRVRAAKVLTSRAIALCEPIARDATVDTTVRVDALAVVVARFPDPRVGPLLARLLEDPTATLRTQAVRAIGTLRHRQSLPYLERVLESDHGTVLEIPKAILAIGDRQAEGLLLRLIDHPSQVVRAATLDALERMGTEAALPALSKMGDEGAAATAAGIRARTKARSRTRGSSGQGSPTAREAAERASSAASAGSATPGSVSTKL